MRMPNSQLDLDGSITAFELCGSWRAQLNWLQHAWLSSRPRTNALAARLGAADRQLGREHLRGAVLCDLIAGEVHHP